MKAITPATLAALRAIALPLACCVPALRAAVTLTANDEFMVDSPHTGDLTVAGDLSVVKGIDFGMTTATPPLAAVQLNYFGDSNSAISDLTAAGGTFQWRDNLAVAARNKLQLDGANNLTLYKSDGTTTGILLNPNTSQITLPATGGGIYAGTTPLFTIDSAGKLTIAGGLGVTQDTYINGVRVGKGAGNNATNTADGVNSLNANTTGFDNTATGYNALGTNTSGFYNTANGANALGSNTTGYFNTASGIFTLTSNTTGFYNTAAGAYALKSNTTGYFNTGSGADALKFNTTGIFNTAIGSDALIANTTGIFNTTAGSYSLSYNTTGSFNVAIGANAGKYLAAGPGNLTDPKNSIYLGANSRGFSNLDQNSIVIGYEATGEGANTTVIGNSNTLTTHIYGQVDVSALTINHAPVMTRTSSTNSALTGGALLALGSFVSATQPDAIAIGNCSRAFARGSVAIGSYASCSNTAYDSLAIMGGQANGGNSLATGMGTANGYFSMACQRGVADGISSIAIGGFDITYGSRQSNLSSGANSTTLGGIGNQAIGFASYASGLWTKAVSAHEVALGSLNRGLGTNAISWVETDALLELGNGSAPRSGTEPAASTRSNAITTLKNGLTTLTNKAWLANPGAPLADPPPATDSGGEALVVEGHTRLKGKVIIEQVQGDISMGIYGP